MYAEHQGNRTKVYREIDKDIYPVFCDLFKHSGGYFLANPLEFKSCISVRYGFNSKHDYEQFEASLNILTKQIVEKDGRTNLAKFKTFFRANR